MKKFSVLLLALVLCFSALFLTACQNDDTPAGVGGDKTNTDKMTLGAVEDLKDFVIVRSDTGRDGEKKAATSLRKALSDKFGADMKIVTDYGSSEKQKEILVGLTGRQASIDAYGLVEGKDSAYIIRRDGDKIVILAGSDDALLKAVDFWTTSMVNSAGALCVPNGSDGYVHYADVKFDSMTIFGTNIREYAIFYDNELNADLANKLSDLIFNACDVRLEVTQKEGIAKKMFKIDITEGDPRVSAISVGEQVIQIDRTYYDEEWVIRYLSNLFDEAQGDSFDFTANLDTKVQMEFDPLYDKEDLMKVLEKVYNSDQIIVGTELKNGPTVVTDMLEYFYEESGEFPGILGLDLRLSNLVQIDEAGMARLIADLTNFAKDGGIVTASAHFANPAENGGDPTIENYKGKFGGDAQWAQLITEGTAYNTSFKQELKAIADFLEELKMNGVPVIWRPLHETNGNWFWFCMVQDGYRVSESSFINLWVYIHDYFTKERGLDNLLWEFGPNIGSESQSMTAPLYGFPGKDYVDLVGFDWYTTNGDTTEIYNTPTYKDLEKLGMIINLNEFGPKEDLIADTASGEVQADIFSCNSILGFFEEFKRGDFKFGYMLTWTGNVSIPALGHSDEFMAHEITLGQADVKKLFEELN